MNRIAVFASGAGSNADKLMEHFLFHPQWSITLLCTNNQDCGAIEVAAQHGVPVYVFSMAELEGDEVLYRLEKEQIDAVVLAGFMRKIPLTLIQLYHRKMFNIHPALLPKFGGRGMYGMHVHRAVIEANETESGITIHLVNEVYDQGEILAQVSIPVTKLMTPEQLHDAVLKLEHFHYPRVVEQYLMSHAG